MCDFGFSRKINSTSKVSGGGTNGFKAPEVVLCPEIHRKIDLQDEKFCEQGKKDSSALDVWSLAAQAEQTFFNRNTYLYLLKKNGAGPKPRREQKRRAFRAVQHHVAGRKHEFKG